ncbi:hypothetical protein CLV59_10127 [Chitinophaga dinghuensis]|uniref:Uncharacterized protein n=1 Tax=Chitinophaga dinghuensis TaxID=1539050 RepID=A0A327WAT4_9BACT|nr:hypothetical protein [Chitinophaga dinghuensis]RAJ87278.1 hypothetical protein CLV59_10127 [Chitinophaga dinghuensis]
MNLANYKPDLLLHEKFAELVLQSHDSYSQIWTSDELYIDINYYKDTCIYFAINTINLEAVTPQSWYWRYKSFTPPLLAEYAQNGKNYILETVTEDLVENTIIQAWGLPEEVIEVLLSEDLQIKQYRLITQDNGYDVYSIYSPAIKLKQRLTYISDSQVKKEYYFPNGNRWFVQYETDEGDKIKGPTAIYNEDGALLAEFEEEQLCSLPPIHDALSAKIQVVLQRYNTMKQWQEMPNKWAGADIFEAFLYEVLGHENIYKGYHEDFASVNDYENLFHIMATMAGIPVNFTVEESDEHWDIQLHIQNDPIKVSIMRDTDWFNLQFIERINMALRNNESTHTFYIFQSGGWGQELGIVYMHDALGKCIDEIIHRLDIRYNWGSLDNRLETRQQ